MASQQSGDTPKVIEMQDMTSFKWVMLNILGHDFMHDFLLNTARTKKGQVNVGNKKVSIIKKVNKTCRAISKYLKNPGLMARLSNSKNSKGGGFFDNPDDGTLTSIDYEDTIDTAEGKEQTNYSSYEKELNHMVCILKELEGDSSASPECGFVEHHDDGSDAPAPVSREVLTAYVSTYFENLYDTETDERGITSYNPKIIKILAEGMVSGVLSPVIKNVLEIGTNHQALNKNKESYIIQEMNNNLFSNSHNEPEDESEETYASAASESAAEKSSGEPFFSQVSDGEPIFGIGDNADGLYGHLLNKIEVSFGNIFGVDLNTEERLHGIFNTRGFTLSSLRDIEANPELLFSQKDNSEPSKNTTISEIEDTITNGLYSDRVFFDLTKKLIIKNFVDAYSSRVGERKGMFSIFKSINNQFIFDMDPIYKTIDDLTRTLNNKFNSDMQTEESLDDYDIFSRSKNPVDEFLKILTENKIQITGTIGSSDQETLKNLYYGAIFEVHPDRNPQNPHLLELAKIVNSEYRRLNKTFTHTGGFIQKGGASDDDKLFAVMNTILNKAIIENSLVLMDCVSGDKNVGYFPDVNAGGLPEGVADIRQHGGLRPNFKNIFSGEILQSFLSNDRFSTKTQEGVVIGINWSEIIHPDVRENTLEVRKILAKRILLNTQILILYQRCIPSGISTNSLFDGLLLKMDDKKRRDDILSKRGYLTLNLKETQKQQDFLQQFGVSSLEEAQNNVLIRRQRYFGMLFDGTAPNVLPDWFKRSNTEDDMLQNAFNIVLVKLLPEFIFELGIQPHILVNEAIPQKADIPNAGVDGDNAYVINNAVPLIYPQLKKASQGRFGFLNLDGIQARNSQFCPVTSIADSQPLCSIKTNSSLKETVPRALNYSMEMGLEAPIKAGTYSYYVNMVKQREDDSNSYLFHISGVLTGPDFLIHIGNETETLDLKLGPLSAVNTFYKILQNISLISKESVLRKRERKFEPRVILRQFFEANCEILMKAGVIKSIGDYGQEFTALSKYGATTKNIYDRNNQFNDNSGRFKTIPYNDKGNALRFMVANDRPSAYRGIFISLFANQKTINTRAVLGYYREKRQDGVPSKNTLVMGMNVLNSDGSGRINNIPEEGDRDVTFTDNVRNIVNESRNRGRLKNVLKIRKSQRQAQRNPSSRVVTMFFRRYPEFKDWSKQRGIVIQPTNFRKRAQEFATDFNRINPGDPRRINFSPGGNLDWVMRGGKKKRKIRRKKTKRKKRKIKRKKTKRKKRKIKRKTKRKKRKSKKTKRKTKKTHRKRIK